MYLDINDRGLSRDLIIDGIREIKQTNFFKKLLKPNMTVLDIGANIGYFALIEAEVVGPNGKVYAIEPIPQSYNLLKKNIKLNNYEKIFKTYPIAIGEKKGNAIVKQTKKLNWSTILNNNLSKVDKKIKVKKQTVDSFLKNKKKPDVIRMDVEGYELEIFKGMRKTLSSKKPMILFIEFHPMYLHDRINELKSLIKKIQSKGFKPIKLTDTSGFREFKINEKKFAEQVCTLDAPGVFMQRK